MAEEKRKAGTSERLFVGVILTIIGLFGLGSGTLGFGMMGGMMGYGGYSPLSIVILAVFLGVTLFGLYIIYGALKE